MVTAETQKFSAPIGHERRWDALVNAFQKGMVPQTLLLSGPHHVGKTLLVKRFAQLLMCPNVDITSTRPAPCLSCKTCHQIEIETFPDFKIYRPVVGGGKDLITAPESLDSSAFLIEQARSFAAEAMYNPTVAKYKVMVIAQAHRMTEVAQQCLLKTLEEPISGVRIILTCEERGTLLDTTLSRCWHLPVPIVADEKVYNWLKNELDAPETIAGEATKVANGLPGNAWRELQRLRNNADAIPRTSQIHQMVQDIENSLPFAALRLTERALQIAEEWGKEDEKISITTERYDPKKVEKKLTRSQAARFLDELSNAYRVKWAQAATQNATSSTRSDGADEAERWARGLDQIRKTRHYILRNANTTLALDVLFMRLIRSAHGEVL